VPQSGRIRIPARAAVCAVLAAVAMGLAVPSVASAQVSAARVCPFTFDVLHDDHIGRLSLPRGAYRITVSGPLSCAGASDLFRQFLEDFDGVLARPWKLSVSTRTFRRGSSSVGFTVAAAGSNSGGGGGGHYPSGSVCPGTFRIVQNDHIGTFDIPKGVYSITLLSVGRITCSQASSYLSQFLADFDGILPNPWFIDTETGSFMRGSRNVGFRIKETVDPPNPSGGGGGGSTKRCPGTFRVQHNDSIGALKLPRGPYWITLLKGSGLSCRGASNLFQRFLDDFDGVLSPPWVVVPRSGTFTRGRGSSTGFRVKQA
jgi:hypothetical protein